MQQFVPELELLARQTRARPLTSELTLRQEFGGRLTPRQREVLQLAYRSGFFESPRVQTEKELLENLWALQDLNHKLFVMFASPPVIDHHRSQFLRNCSPRQLPRSGLLG
ncbi:helix-turn-helix domain-containing protein [Natrinema gelatinilyticum]|uniref:helix-turn-helix domain-containing protein n=1 Tax=Natrinema gelatinilyticum TaxID=2961571 RepID=UPI0021143A57|nr:helix-turn-helix domain-containing protein [Natrinema gelatinilyticum]